MHSREHIPDHLFDHFPVHISSRIQSLPCAPEHDSMLAPERDSAARRFTQLGLMAIETQWLANFSSACTRRAYAADVRDFAAFSGLQTQTELLQVARSHVLAWRHHMQAQGLSPSTQRRKLAALSSLLEHLVDEQLIPTNPARDVRRPRLESHEGKTPALSLEQAQALLEAPDAHTLKGLRDRAILAVMLLGGLRRAEVVALRVRDFDVQRAGVPHLRVMGKGGKTRFIAVAPLLRQRVLDYLAMRGVSPQSEARLFVRMQAVKGKCGAPPEIDSEERCTEEGRGVGEAVGMCRPASKHTRFPAVSPSEEGSQGPAGGAVAQWRLGPRRIAARSEVPDAHAGKTAATGNSVAHGSARRPAALTAGAVAQRIVQPYLAQIGVVGERFSAHALRVTAATLALRERADLNEVRHFLGHACITTTTAYDRRWSDAGRPVGLVLPFV
jgi:site-specific recombinase XerD